MRRKLVNIFHPHKLLHDIRGGWNAYAQLSNQPVFGRAYLLLSSVILAVSTLFWVTLGARVQSANADQFVAALLFHAPSAISHAFVPDAHSFLLKWPLFMLIGLFHSPQTALMWLTVIVVIVTVAAFAWVLSRIERRPVVLGTLLLLMASALLLVPPVPAPGNLLPVNMAMLTTRNIEYVVYLAAIWLIIKNRRYRSWNFGIGVLLLGILVASDKLFVPITVGGAFAALLVYSVVHGWNMVSSTVKWAVASIVACALSLVLLAILTAHAVHLSHNGTVSPYAISTDAHQLLIGVIYAVMSLATNMGANPAPQTTVLATVPHQSLHNILSLSGPAIILNALFLVFSLICAVSLVRLSVRHNKSTDYILKPSGLLSLSLVWSAAASIGAFIFSRHYFAGDARYIAIAFFALFMATAYTASHREWRLDRLGAVGAVAVICMMMAVPGVIKAYHINQAALAGIKERNASVVSVVTQHGATVLVGDYWRVIPEKISSSRPLSILPLQDCSQPRTTLTSDEWAHDLTKTKFAYLLSLDKGLTDFPQCSLQQVIDAFGRPNSSTVIAGTLANPTELVLFYDHGAHKSDPVQPKKDESAATVLPIAIDDYPYKVCNVPTVINVVAHEDDDLLFMNPDLTHDLQAGHCVRTVYVTAGDSGNNSYYWVGRMRGSEAAYGDLIGYKGIWVERIVQIKPDQLVAIANPRGNSKVSLVFMYLPDGNLKGQGFVGTGNESIERLDVGAIPRIAAVYGGSSYTKESLTAALTSLFFLFQPSEIHTQSNFVGSRFPDHSDHRAVGRFTQRALQNYQRAQFDNKIQIPLTYYLGYPTHELAPNVSGPDLQQKEMTFMNYSQFDDGVCHSLNICMHDPAYGAYLDRQHTWPY